MELLEAVLQILVIGGFFIYIYTKVKRQTLQETFEEIKELIKSLMNN